MSLGEVGDVRVGAGGPGGGWTEMETELGLEAWDPIRDPDPGRRLFGTRVGLSR